METQRVLAYLLEKMDQCLAEEATSIKDSRTDRDSLDAAISIIQNCLVDARESCRHGRHETANEFTNEWTLIW
jgi:hypothetical protein